MPWLWITVGAVPVLVLIGLYNRLVRHRNLVDEAWSGIDVQLKLRHSLVPNLVETVKGYAAHERQVLEDVVRLRGESESAQSPEETEEAEVRLSRALEKLIALSEDYPELKASRSFGKLQEQLAEVEDRIQKARRYYNGSVRDYNIRIESFPSNLVAAAFGFAARAFFELDSAAERLVPEVRFAPSQEGDRAE